MGKVNRLALGIVIGIGLWMIISMVIWGATGILHTVMGLGLLSLLVCVYFLISELI